MAGSETVRTGTAPGPQIFDLDRCVHCGLCLNACPTYRELGLEMDSPRGRVYQMVKVAEGEMPIGPSYIKHLELCLACRACETACPSGVQYGRLIEAARAQIETVRRRSLPARLLRGFIFNRLLVSPRLLRLAGNLLWVYQASGMRALAESTGLLKSFGRLGRLAPLTPEAERPFFFDQIGKTFPAEGKRRYRVAFLAGCIANVCFARLNEATVRVLQKNGCDVVIPAGQGCCGALHVHSGMREEARRLARRNIDAIPAADFDAIITNAAGCGSTLKEYHELLADDSAYAARAAAFSRAVRDVTEFLASIELNRDMRPVRATVTYQDSCHLAHGQRVRLAPRRLLQAVPGLEFRQMPLSDLCCGSAGIYNVVQSDMAAAILAKKMESINGTGADIIATANPGCMLQLRAGAALYGQGRRVAHVVELLDEAYRREP
ncbi:MAG TPA: (Fe-S)-binding protein [Bryobacteraceae bacterium]|nr:(Fe-S)-binding protein [Bryobacteraceae bacterium]HOQ46237.1 (Fe-S)-binding protein [Bryobacteraceae bacterium]HPQ14928.1 (Fe-S)-binding protein [Bryobacteraceae bacterium]HPU74226.1 (Fe-S)-binding protein [Bryobacteraceae bacterium]